MRILTLVLFFIVASGCVVLENNPAPVKPTGTQPALGKIPEKAVEMVEAVPTQTVQLPAATQTNKSSLEDFGPAPEIKNEVWLNVDNPLRLAELGGKVVLLEMWTFG